MSCPCRERRIRRFGRRPPFCGGLTLSSSNSHLFIFFIFRVDFRRHETFVTVQGGQEEDAAGAGEVTTPQDRESKGLGSVEWSRESDFRLLVRFLGENRQAKGLVKPDAAPGPEVSDYRVPIGNRTLWALEFSH